jgi:hypothetical protein
LLVPLHLTGFLISALACHCELAASRPKTPQLTEFYFWVACGGVLGGLFNTLIAPLLFTNIIEYPLGLACVLALRSPIQQHQSPARMGLMDRAVPLAVAVLAAVLCLAVRLRSGAGASLLVPLGVPAIIAFSQSSRQPRRFALSVAAILFVGWGFGYLANQDLYAERTFFGLYRVRPDSDGRHHLLFSGTTLHGMQAVHDPDRGAPLSYFHRTGPIGQAFLSLPAISQVPEVAVVGLGVGSLAAYAGPGQHWTFYEIDPAIERIARDPHFFTYLRDCASRCSTVIGDARLSLTRARPNQFGLIVLDAFSSDAIPLHLLTEQALGLYLTRLDRHGILALHISNRHLALGPVLGRLARTHGLIALEQQQDVSSGIESGKASSDWIIMARDEADLGTLTRDPRWTKPAVSQSTPLWTDDFTNILSVVKFRRN